MSCCVAYLGVVSSLSLVSVMYVPTQSQLQELDLQTLMWGDNAQNWERLHVTVTLETKKLAKSGCEYGVSLLPVDSDGFPLEIETGQLRELGCATQICAFVDGVKVCDVNDNPGSDLEVDTVMGKCHVSIPTALANSTINTKRFVGLNATWLHSDAGNYTCEITHLDDMTLTVTLEPFTAMYDCEDNFFWSHQDEECKPCQNEDILSLCPPGHFVRGCDALAHVGESYCSPCENTPANFDTGFYAWHPTSECVLECVNNQQYQYFMNGTVCSPCTQSLRTCSEDPENNCCAKTPGKMWQACTSSQNEQCVDCPEILKLQYSQNEVHIPWTSDCESYFIQSFYTLPKEPPYCECQTTCIDNHYRSLTIPNVPCVPCSTGQELLLTAEASAEAGETYKFQQCTKASNTQILQCERKELGCDGIPYSGKVFDLCDVCGGDNSTCVGCDGVIASGKKNDDCGICDGDSTTCQGCDGVPNSGLVVDVCGQCGGDNTSCWGCDNVSNSGLVFDACGECGGDGSSCWGCDNVSNSELVFDACNVCGGDNATCTGCDGVLFSGKVPDSCGDCDGGDQAQDGCGVCYGDNTSCVGCDGILKSGIFNDSCGVCGGDNSTCAGCDNITNSGKVIDFCGVCGGNNDTCIGCDGVLWQPYTWEPVQVNLARYCGETKDQQCPVSASSYHSFAPPYLATNGIYEDNSNSPNYDTLPGGWRSSAGVDTHTQIYLKIDFGQAYTVNYIKVYPWQGSLSHYKIGLTEYRVGDSDGHRSNNVCAFLSQHMPDNSVKTLNCGATGRYLFVTKIFSGPSEIWLAEIEAYGTVMSQRDNEEEIKRNDECGICGGDNSTCLGCDGIPNSGLVLDECNVCDGDNTSCQGCDGVPNSGLVVDVCNQCGGDNTSCWGCDNISNSGLVFDVCGECGGDGSSCLGCDGILNSGLVLDECNVCGGNNCNVCGADNSLCTKPTGVQYSYPVSSIPDDCTPCYDQAYNHATQMSDIETCKSAAGADGWIGMGALYNYNTLASSFSLFAFIRANDFVQSSADFQAYGPHNGVYWYMYNGRSVGFASTSSIDIAGGADFTGVFSGPCGSDRLSWHLNGLGGSRVGCTSPLNDAWWWRKMMFSCSLCSGPNSGLVLDQCNVCGGTNSTCLGCDGVPNSGAVLDQCNVCGGNNSTCLGCDGIPNSALVLDECNVCGGDNSTCVGCDGVYYLTTPPKQVDDCGVCGGANEDKDSCGVCGGDNSTCAGCDGIPNSGAVVDQCNVCGGNSSTCIYPWGVRHYYPVSSIPDDCTPCYDQWYNHGTQMSHIETCKTAAGVDGWIGMGAKYPASASSFRILAFIRANDFVQSSSAFQAYGPHNGVYWYMYNGKSVGFASTSSIYILGGGDTSSSDCSNRLSWHLTGSGGWRAGCTTYLNINTAWRKIMFSCPMV